MKNVITSYGKCAQGTGFMYGSGYGKNKKITFEVDNLSTILAPNFPNLRFEKRCNSDGESGGIHSISNMSFGLNVNNVNKKFISLSYMKNMGQNRDNFPDIVYSSYFEVSPRIFEIIKNNIEYKDVLKSYDKTKYMITSYAYKRPKMALNWLLNAINIISKKG